MIQEQEVRKLDSGMIRMGVYNYKQVKKRMIVSWMCAM